MSKFDVLFSEYSSRAIYIAKLGSMVKPAENEQLYKNTNALAGNYGFGQPYTIGYGYDISKQNGKTILKEFAAAGIALPANITALLANYRNGNNSTKLNDLDTAFRNGGAGSSKFSLTEAQAASLLNVVLPRYEGTTKDIVVANTSYANGFTLGNNGLHALVVSEVYNAGNAVFGQGQNDAIKTDDTNGFIFDVLFKNNKANSQYVVGLENRRIIDLSEALGVTYGPYGASNRITNIAFNGNVIAAVDVYRALRAKAAEIATVIAGYAAGTDGYTQLFQLNNNLLASSKTTLSATGTGFYVVQSGETKAALATKFATDTALLDRLNGSGAGFTDVSGFAAGDIVRVPAGAVAVNSGATIITAASRYQVLGYDGANSKIYTTGTTLDRNGNGQIIDTASGQAMTLLTTDGIIGAAQPASGTLRLTGAANAAALPNFTATLDGTKLSLTGSLIIKPTTDPANQVRTEIKANSFVNDGKITVGAGSALKITGPITSTLSPMLAGVAMTPQTDGSTFSIGGTNLIGSGTTPISWTGSARIVGGGWSTRYGRMANLLDVDNPDRLTVTNPALRGMGAPFYAQGIAVRSRPSPDVYTPITYSTDTITYNFSAPLPVGTRFYLVDPGASERVYDQATKTYIDAKSFSFNFAASFKNSGGVSAPVAGAFSLAAYDPYGYINGFTGNREWGVSATGSYALNSAAGTVTATNNPNSWPHTFPYRPDTIVVATTKAPIDSITVTGQTILYDQWGLFFDVGSPEIKIASNGTLELNGAVDASQRVTFDSAGQETLILDDAANFKGTIKNFGFGDRIVIKTQNGAQLGYAHNFLGLLGSDLQEPHNRFFNRLTIIGYPSQEYPVLQFARDEDLSRINLTGDISDPSAVAYIFGGYVFNGMSTNDVIEGSDGDDIINGYSGADTINAGSGNDEIVLGGNWVGSTTIFNNTTIDAGAGDDLVSINGSGTSINGNGTPVIGVSVFGGTGDNTVSVQSADISTISFSTIQKLEVKGANGELPGYVKLTAAQLAQFDTIQLGPMSSVFAYACEIYAATPGNYNFQGKTKQGVASLKIYGTGSNDTIYGLSSSEILAGAGNDTIYATGDSASIARGGDGDDLFIADFSYPDPNFIIKRLSTYIYGDAGNNTLRTIKADWDSFGIWASNSSISNVQTLEVADGVVCLKGDQLDGFSTLVANVGRATIQVSRNTVERYDLSNKITNGIFDLSAVNSPFKTYLTGNGASQSLTGGWANDVLQGLGGADNMQGGDGDDEFMVGGDEVVLGEAIDGGTGYDKISAWGGNLSLATISNIEMLGAASTGAITLSSSQLAGFGQLANWVGTPVTLQASVAGAYVLYDKYVDGTFNLAGTIGNDYLAGDGTAQTLTGGDGNDVLQGLGGADNMQGGNGDDEFLVGGTEIVSGEIINGGAGNNKISAWGGNLSLATISNVKTLALNTNAITMSAAQFGGFTTFQNNVGAVATITASNAGTYDLSVKTATGSAISLAGSSGNDILRGNAAAQTLTGNAGNDTLDGKAGADSLIGGTGNDMYVFGLGYGADSVTENDATAGNTDILSILSGTARDQLWFTKSGNDLQVRIIGTSDIATIKNWYLGSANKVEQIKTSAGNTLVEAKVQNLVNAMAGLAVPSTTTLSAAYHTLLDPVIAANWT